MGDFRRSMVETCVPAGFFAVFVLALVVPSASHADPFTTQLYMTCDEMFDSNTEYLLNADLPSVPSTEEDLEKAREIYANAPMNIALSAYLSNFDESAVAEVVQQFVSKLVDECQDNLQRVLKEVLDTVALDTGLAKTEADLPPIRK